MRWLGVVLALLCLDAGIANAKCRVLNTTGTKVLFGHKSVDAYELLEVANLDSGFKITLAGAKDDVVLVKKATCTGFVALRERDGAFTLEVLPAWLDVSFANNVVRVKAPAGAKVTIAGQEHAVAKVPIEQTLEPRAALLAADLRGVSALDSLRFAPIRLRIVHAKKTTELVLGVDVALALKTVQAEMKDIAEKPLAWATALAGGAPHPSIWMACETTGCALQGGVGITTLASAQLVAIGQAWTKTIETCKYGSGMSAKLSVDRLQQMQDISVFEATTGKELAKITFAGQLPDACPATQSASKTITGSFDRKPVLDWLKTH